MKPREILKECKKHAKIRASDYDTIKDYRTDCRTRNKDLAKCMDLFQLFPIDYDYQFFGVRLIVLRDALEYTAGQYTPTEIYWHLSNELMNIIKEKLACCSV
jgi:hypothetical protein